MVNYTRSNPTTDVNVAINSGIPNNGFQRSDRQNKPTAQLNNLSSFEARTPKHLVPCPFLHRKGHCLKGTRCDFSHNDVLPFNFLTPVTNYSTHYPFLKYRLAQPSAVYQPPPLMGFPTTSPRNRLWTTVTKRQTFLVLIDQMKLYPDKTCALNFIPVIITQWTTVNDARRTSNPNNLIYPRSDPLPVNPIHRSCHFVPSIILANVMSLTPKIDEIRLYVQDHVPDIMCFTETWLKDTVENSVIHLGFIPLSGKTGYMHNMGEYAYILKTLYRLYSPSGIRKRYIN